MNHIEWTPISTFYNAQLLEEKRAKKIMQERAPEEIEEQLPSGDNEMPDAPNEGKTMVNF